MRSILALALLAAATAEYAACTGKSAGLPDKECKAWQDFYDALDGPNWVAFGSPSSAFPQQGRTDPCSVKSKIGNPCSGNPATSGSNFTRGLTKVMPGGAGLPPWQEPDAGVCCSTPKGTTQLHITQLAFGLNGLKGAIPDSVNDLEELDNLSACGCNITTLPQDMTNTKVGFLRLHVNSVTGTMPASYSKMTNLEYISLSDNKMTGSIPDLSGLPKLRGAYLDCNQFTGTVPASWGGKVVSDFKSCFLSEGTGEKCASGYKDNNLACPLPAGTTTNCHAKCNA